MSLPAGFSLWADFIERDFLDTEFPKLIAQGIVNGATSNPAIFKQAILTSPAYKAEVASLCDVSPKVAYEQIAIADIQKAADVLRPLYDAGNDGFVSIEVDPFLCDDTEATIAEGRALHAAIKRPNVMIKVPATSAGYEAMRALMSEGINVNATLIFTKAQALQCAEAFAKGNSEYGAPVQGVISVFVSRIDRALDSTLEAHGVEPGLAGIYNAAAIYNAIEARQESACRTLFASTGVKGDAYPADYYVTELLAKHSVNTAPIATVEAFIASGNTMPKLPIDDAIIEAHFKKIASAGIDYDAVLQQQIDEGLEAFKVAFQEILDALQPGGA